MTVELREMLRKWGVYAPHFDDGGRLIGYWWEALPIDSMTDREVLNAARQVAAGPVDRSRYGD